MLKYRMLFVVLSLVAALCAAQAPDITRMDIVERSVPAGPVALVDGVAIEGHDFLRNYRRHLMGVMQMVGEAELDDEFRVHAGLTILGDMIRAEILYAEARRRTLNVSDTDVAADYSEKLQAFAEMLEHESGVKPSEAQVLEKAGQTREEALDSIRKQLLVEKVSEQIAGGTGGTVSTADARRYYDNNPQLFEVPGRLHLNQMLVVPKPNAARADENAWRRAEEQMEHARARTLAGEQFAAVARDVSESPDAQRGGDMGAIPASELPPFFVDIAGKMRPGDISGVFRSQYGVHMIRLLESEAAETVAFSDAEEHIKRVLGHVKTEEAVLQFCEPIVNDGDRTKIFIQLERTLAALGL